MNISKLQKKLEENNLDAIVLFSPVNIRYLSKFYITDGAAVITRSSARMFTDSRYIEAATAQAEELAVSLFDREHRLSALLKDALSGCTAVGAEEGTLSHGDWQFWEEKLGVTFTPAESILQELRSVKEPYELESIIAAQRIAEAALEETLPLIRPGMTERQLAAELTYRMLLHGGEGNSFDPIAITGKKTSMPHGVPGDEVIQNGDFVTMDFGCIKNGYCSDMTRTVAVGYATDEMREVYDTVLRAQEAGIALAKAGVTGAAVHNAGAAVIEASGYGAYFGHGFGHGVGLEIHESPNASPANEKPLPVGTVITAEPGIYLPGKFGVRIEDMLYLTADGNLDLTEALKELIILK